jgi:hypothetical protein
MEAGRIMDRQASPRMGPSLFAVFSRKIGYSKPRLRPKPPQSDFVTGLIQATR